MVEKVKCSILEVKRVVEVIQRNLYREDVKSYQQFCSVARALDVVGDRWVILIVRELLTFGPSRYSDLKRGLPGIATNLLAERLRLMEADGLIERYDAPAPVGANLYQLTERGRGLQDVVRALGRWGLDLMPAGALDGDAVQPQWTALYAAMELSPAVSEDAVVVVGVETGDEAVRAILRHDSFEVRRGTSPPADVTVSGPATLVGGILTGLLTPKQGTDLGAEITGADAVLTDLLQNAARAGDTTGASS
jgi:DNA-binding HxlR family transcriptional regulator